MTANDSKSSLGYFNKLVDQYNNTYHHSNNKKPINANYSVLTKKLSTILEFLESELLSIRMFLVKLTLKTGPEKYFFLILF